MLIHVFNFINLNKVQSNYRIHKQNRIQSDETVLLAMDLYRISFERYILQINYNFFKFNNQLFVVKTFLVQTLLVKN